MSTQVVDQSKKSVPVLFMIRDVIAGSNLSDGAKSVLFDVIDRQHCKGVSKYGEALTGNTNCDMLIHAIEESVDQSAYLMAECFHSDPSQLEPSITRAGDTLGHLAELIAARPVAPLSSVGVSMVQEIKTRPNQGWFLDVLEFHRKLAPSRICNNPSLPTNPVCRTLIEEEDAEMFAALDRGDLPEFVDGILDSIYVRLGMLVHCGVNPDPIWAAIQSSNMAKEGGDTRADGKVLKPPGWTAPDVAGLLRKQGWEG